MPYDPLRDEVVLVEQFRAGAISVAQVPEEAWLLEVVATIEAEKYRLKWYIVKYRKKRVVKSVS
ncbi:MAG: hypothetical protein R3E08_13030 [Thiotrichaceae bacterium]